MSESTGLLRMSDPNFVCTGAFSLKTKDKEFIFDEGDPISLRKISIEKFSIGEDFAYATVLLLDQDTLADKVLPFIRRAEFKFIASDTNPSFDVSLTETTHSVIDRILTIPMIECSPLLYKERKNYEDVIFVVPIGEHK